MIHKSWWIEFGWAAICNCDFFADWYGVWFRKTLQIYLRWLNLIFFRLFIKPSITLFFILFNRFFIGFFSKFFRRFFFSLISSFFVQIKVIITRNFLFLFVTLHLLYRFVQFRNNVTSITMLDLGFSQWFFLLLLYFTNSQELSWWHSNQIRCFDLHADTWSWYERSLLFSFVLLRGWCRLGWTGELLTQVFTLLLCKLSNLSLRSLNWWFSRRSCCLWCFVFDVCKPTADISTLETKVQFRSTLSKYFLAALFVRLWSICWNWCVISCGSMFTYGPDNILVQQVNFLINIFLQSVIFILEVSQTSSPMNSTLRLGKDRLTLWISWPSNSETKLIRWFSSLFFYIWNSGDSFSMLGKLDVWNAFKKVLDSCWKLYWRLNNLLLGQHHIVQFQKIVAKLFVVEIFYRKKRCYEKMWFKNLPPSKYLFNLTCKRYSILKTIFP